MREEAEGIRVTPTLTYRKPMSITLTPTELTSLAQQIQDVLLPALKIALSTASKASADATQCLTVAEVAKRLKCHSKTVCKYIEEGKLAAANIGTWERPQYRVSEKDFTTFYKGHRRA
ncbi:helix-turn-helix domain-containing protein [Hymenobacter sp. UV11]|uniref:helix-turn-helix domain-containing protein n=1 Tax=Hymenobacter sp. UV11 TaxID=1849735 RepID=UPI0010D680CD|nr:hypothetical protein A8B98_15300 [Hymenobacter sp. UV11]